LLTALVALCIKRLAICNVLRIAPQGNGVCSGMIIAKQKTTAAFRGDLPARIQIACSAALLLK
jgi:hypothetical protein